MHIQIQDRISGFKSQLRSQIVGRQLSRKELEDYAMAQFINSASWPACMADMQAMCSTPVLKEALQANVLDEVGVDGTPHINLCRRFIESLGITPRQALASMLTGNTKALHMLEDAMSLKEAGIGGWMLATELLTPDRFQLIRPYYHVLGADMAYLDEHIAVDTDVHAKRIEAGVDALIAIDPENLTGIMRGIDIGGKRALAFLALPDHLPLHDPAKPEVR